MVEFDGLGHSAAIHTEDEELAEDYASEIIPIYPATKEVTSWDLTKALRATLDIVTFPPDPLPERIRAGRKLTGLELEEMMKQKPKPAKETAPAVSEEAGDHLVGEQQTTLR